MIPDKYKDRMARAGMTEEKLRDEWGIQPKTEHDWDILMNATMRFTPNPLPKPYRGVDLFTEGVFTVDEAADHLRLDRSTIYRAMERGDLPSQKLGKARRIPRRALRIWTEAY